VIHAWTLCMKLAAHFCRLARIVFAINTQKGIGKGILKNIIKGVFMYVRHGIGQFHHVRCMAARLVAYAALQGSAADRFVERTMDRNQLCRGAMTSSFPNRAAFFTCA